MMYRWTVLAGLVAAAGCGPAPVNVDRAAATVDGVTLAEEGATEYARVAGVVRNGSARAVDARVQCIAYDEERGVVGSREAIVGPVPPGGSMPFAVPVAVGDRKGDVAHAGAVLLDATPAW